MTPGKTNTARIERFPVRARREELADRFGRIRDTTSALCSSLELEDCVVQSLPEASPIKWHLAHTTWFFEQFVLKLNDYQPFDSRYELLFNSYYQSVGPQIPQSIRGRLSRPTVSEIIRYRRYVDEAIRNLLADSSTASRWHSLIELGLHHEQQHQELMLTDIKHAFFSNPSLPAYRQTPVAMTNSSGERSDCRWAHFESGMKWVGAETGFSFDNERPRHRVFVEPYDLADRLVTNGEYLEFVRAGGYRDPRHWLSDGWEFVKEQSLARPLYWNESLDGEFTLHGSAELALDAPVCHLSYFEADAFARWAGKRLPTEVEWEWAAASAPVEGNLLSSDTLQPMPASGAPSRSSPRQLFGDTWEWTRSSYAPYPGYQADAGALGEYNGKFMSGRMVLRGGSCATPDDHIRATYRNYFDPRARWQFSGVRLAQ